MKSLLKLKRNTGAVRKRKTVGRGNGSGHGTYATRGGKGQTARTGSGYKPGFEGGQTPLYRKMPKLKGFNNINHVTYQVVNVGDLNLFEDGEEIDVIKLYEKGLVSKKDLPVKILGDGELTKKVVLKVDRASKSAKEKIESIKGSITELKPKKTQEQKEQKE